MNRKLMALALLAPSLGAWVVGCSDDENVGTEQPSSLDAGGQDSAQPEPDGGAASDGGDGGDASTGPLCPDTTGLPPRLLVNANDYSNTELAVFNLQTKTLDGKLPITGFGVLSTGAAGPFFVGQDTDIVSKLDPKDPLKVVSSWNVHADDAYDGGFASANPTGVFVPACGKGYVLRYSRNRIAVVDTSKTANGGAADSFIDLSALKLPTDADGAVDMAAAVYVPKKNRLYVLLGNTDLEALSTDGTFSILCKGAKSSIIAIDTTTDKLVSLGGTALGGGIELGGYNPLNRTDALWYDEAGDRLVVLEAGCNVDEGGGRAGAVQQRRVEAVNLTTSEVTTLLSLENQGYPGTFVYVDETRAAINLGLGNDTYLWNPQQKTLGQKVPGNLGAFTYDGKGALVGVRSSWLEDNAQGPAEFVSMAFPNVYVDGLSITKIGETQLSAGQVAMTVDVWPR